jgi:hypothetical protein
MQLICGCLLATHFSWANFYLPLHTSLRWLANHFLFRIIRQINGALFPQIASKLKIDIVGLINNLPTIRSNRNSLLALAFLLLDLPRVYFHTGASRTRNRGSAPSLINSSSAANAPRTQKYIAARLSASA